VRKEGSREPGKSILIVSATVGAGHVRAGEALAAAAESLSVPVTITHQDILDFTLPLFRTLYSKSYYSVVRRSPELWGYLYKRSARATPRESKAGLMRLFDHFNYKKYLSKLDAATPDAVVCTHFLPYLAIEEKILRPGWRIPFFAVTTDYDVHSLWISRAIRRFYAATDEAAWTIRSHDVPEERVSVSGIPVMPQFESPAGRKDACKKLGLQPSLFTILILSGGYGVGVIDELVPSIAQFLSTRSRKTFQLLVVCGKNPDLHAKLKRISFPPNVRATLYQFIPFVDLAMACSDLLITKAGGLTVSEALSSHLPMVILDPFPGQEGRNADYVVEQGAALIATGFSNLHFKLDRLIEHPALLAGMKRRARAIAKPRAAIDILEDVLASI
jgi:processive 1,2-diacylglycerol beta-glucosyltransferase